MFIRMIVGLATFLGLMLVAPVSQAAQTDAPPVLSAAQVQKELAYAQAQADKLESSLNSRARVRSGSSSSTVAYECDGRYDPETGVMHPPLHRIPGSHPSLYWSVYVFYTFCNPNDPDRYNFVEPTHARAAYNLEGSHTHCFKINDIFQHMNANFNFWRPYSGANFNPGEFRVPCDESTVNSRTQYYDSHDVPRLYFGPGDNKPRWKVNLEHVRVGLNRHDSHVQNFGP